MGFPFQNDYIGAINFIFNLEAYKKNYIEITFRIHYEKISNLVFLEV